MPIIAINGADEVLSLVPLCTHQESPGSGRGILGGCNDPYLGESWNELIEVLTNQGVTRLPNPCRATT